MNRLRSTLAWLTMLVAAAVLLAGVVDGLAVHRANRAQARTREEAERAEVESLFRRGLEQLQANPGWAGLEPEVGRGVWRVQVVNRWTSDSGGHGDGIPPHAALLTIVGPAGEVARRVAAPRAPVWKQGQCGQLGPFACPLPMAPPGRRQVGSIDLRPGSYDVLVVGRGASVRLQSGSGATSDFRFSRLILEAGAALQVATDPQAGPVLLHIDRSLELRGRNRLNWPDGRPGQAARLQIYGGPASSVTIRDSDRLSLVLAAPTVRLADSVLRGAVAAQQWESQGSRVEFEQALSGVPLQGLGPWSF